MILKLGDKIKNIIFLFFISLNVLAAEPAWWTQQKQKCGLSSGLAYNSWAAQGSPCNGNSSNGSSHKGVDSGTQQLVEGVVDGAIDAWKKSKADDAAREADLLLRTQEHAALQKRKNKERLNKQQQEEEAEASEQNRQGEISRKALLGGDKPSADSSSLSLIGVDKPANLEPIMTNNTPAQLTPPVIKKKRKCKPVEPDSLAETESPELKKTMAALDCAVKSILDEYKSAERSDQLEAQCLESDLADIKQALKKKPSGENNTYLIQSITISHMYQAEKREGQLVGDILISRNETDGSVLISVLESSSKKAGFLSRLFGKKVKTKQGQNVLTLEPSGDIRAMQVTGPVKKCLNQSNLNIK